MKRALFMATAILLMMSLVSSCAKEDNYVPGTPTNPSRQTMTLNLTTYHWVPDAEGIFVNIFSNVIPANYTNPTVKVYLVQNGSETELSNFLPFGDGLLWATYTQTDIAINYRGSHQNLSFLNIKAVIQ